jgi:hypothetical protein
MRLVEFATAAISPQQLKELETYIDRLFAAVGLDIEFTQHFQQRLGDERNRKPITIHELQRMFKKVHRQMHKGKDLVELGPEAEAVLKDLATNINIPFVLNWDKRNQEFDLIAKTVMRKPDFKTSNDILTVE